MTSNLFNRTRRGAAALIAIAVLVVFAVILVAGATYTVDEAEQTIVLFFNKPVRGPITEPGLHFKWPFVEEVRRFDKRLISWDGHPNQIPTRGEQFISVDTTARWRIVDPLRFLQSVRDERGAQNRLNDILDSVVRDYIASNELVDIVRSHDWEISEEDIERIGVAGESDEEVLLQEVKMGRARLVEQILETAREQMPRYGIELVDVRIKRLDYVQAVQEEVFRRMIAERERIAEQFRSEGRGRAAEIEGETGRMLAEIRSLAERKAEEIRGEADAEATHIYNEAFGADPEFYAFFRTLESYRTTLGRDMTFIIGADSDYFRYMRNIGDFAPVEPLDSPVQIPVAQDGQPEGDD